MPTERIDLGIEGITGAVEIGRGGFAAVYRATQPDFHRDVAVKVIILPSLDEAARNRFRRECRAIGSLSGHPNIVVVHQSGFTANGLPYLIMDYVQNGSLEDALVRDGPRPWHEAARIGVKIARTLGFAHSHNLLHRDVKPANILVSRFGEPQLADFGIAWAIDTTGHSVSAMTTGTPAYAPPETWTGAEPTAAGDIYSLGATVHALITGEPPFMAQSQGNILQVIMQVAQDEPRDLRPVGVPDPLCVAIEWAMAKDPAKRPASADAFADAIEASLTRGAEDGPSRSGPAGLRQAPEAQPSATPPTPPADPPPPQPPTPPAAPPTPQPPAPPADPPRPQPPAPPADPPRPQPPTPTPPPADPPLPQPTPAPAEPPLPQPTPAPAEPPLPQPTPVPAEPPLPQPTPAPAGPPPPLAGSRRAPARPDAPPGSPGPDLARRQQMTAPLIPPHALASAASGELPGAASRPTPSRPNRVVLALWRRRSVVVPVAVAMIAVVATAIFLLPGKKPVPEGPAVLRSPAGLAVDALGNVYVADYGNGRVVKVNPRDAFTTFAGVVGQSDRGNGGDGGPATAAVLSNPQAVTLDPAGNVFMVEGGFIRKVTPAGIISTVPVHVPGAGSPNTISAQAIVVDPQGRLVVATGTDIVQIDQTGGIAVLAGTGEAGFGGDGRPATAAKLNNPLGLAFGANNELYIADSGNNRIRRIRADSTIDTVAGPGGGVAGDGGPASDAALSAPTGIAFDQRGNLYIAESGTNRVRRVDGATGIIETIAGSAEGNSGFAGDGGPAKGALFQGLRAIVIAPPGDLYVTDSDNNRLRRITPNLIVTTVA